MMTDFKNLTKEFFNAYWHSGMKTVYLDKIPKEMLTGKVDDKGWVEWRPIQGRLRVDHYRQVEKNFSIKLPESFIEWHKAYFFLDGDCSIIRLPMSIPTEPLKEIRENLEWNLELLDQGFIPFGYEGNDTGPLVFDTRQKLKFGEYPIRVYDQYAGEMDCLSEVIFSSFPKLLQCITHFLKMMPIKKNFEIIPDFFLIDSEGAGSKGGKAYWSSLAQMLKANYKEFRH